MSQKANKVVEQQQQKQKFMIEKLQEQNLQRVEMHDPRKPPSTFG